MVSALCAVRLRLPLALDGASRGLADSLDPRDINVSYDRYNFREKLTHSSVILVGTLAARGRMCGVCDHTHRG